MRQCPASDSYHHENDKRDISCPKTMFPHACQEPRIGFDGSRVAPIEFVQFPLIWSQAESPLRKEVGAGRHRGDHVRNRPVEPASGNFPESNTKSLHLLDISILFVWLLYAWRVCKFQANFTIWVLCEPSPRHAERGSTELQLESRKIVQGCMV
jgi:hypothetical protein